jgi:hypothetical protein
MGPEGAIPHEHVQVACRLPDPDPALTDQIALETHFRRLGMS